MKVTNRTTRTIKVAINTWGNASTGYYSIEPEKNDSWGREDKRGFVMSVEHNSSVLPYFIFADSNIEVFSDRVERDGSRIEPSK